MAKKRKKKRLLVIVLAFVILVVGFFVLKTVEDKYGFDFGLPDFSGTKLNWIETLIDKIPINPKEDTIIPSSNSDNVNVHFIDVGQGESILVKGKDFTILVDAGDNATEAKLMAYLKEQGVTSIDILVATHPHSDHIGGMEKVVQGIAVDRIIMPNLPDNIIPTSRCFTDLLEAIAASELRITPANPSDVYDLGEDATLTILAPRSSDFENINDFSVVSRLDYGESSFLFTGDLELAGEAQLLETGERLTADVISIGHHGSKTSTSADLLNSVAPSIAVVSCGIDNSYGHPHREVMERLKNKGIKTYRTDMLGTIVISTDGEKITVEE